MPIPTGDLVQFFVECVPGAGRTQIMKFLYLADHDARRYLGRPISALSYIWYTHGPFDKNVLATLEAMGLSGKIRPVHEQYPSGVTACRYYPGPQKVARNWSAEDLAILDHVCRTYGETDPRTLLDEIVYQTKPMVLAKEANAFRQPIRMDIVDNEARIPGLELERIISSIKNLDAGEKRKYKDFFAELKEKASA